jgi:flagellar hook assembly protein FlgD
MTRIAVYDLSGRRVRVLRQDILPAGCGTVLWDGKKDDGSYAATGIYICVLKQGNASVSGSVALLR